MTYTQAIETERADKMHARASALVGECDQRQLSGEETVHESLQRLAYRVAELEHADTRDEYTKD